MSLDRILLNLKVLAQVPKHGRLCKGGEGLIALEQDTFYVSLKRFLFHDSRRQTLREVKLIVEQTSEKVNDLITSKFMNTDMENTEQHRTIIENLVQVLVNMEEATQGVENMKLTTYSKDATTRSELDLLLLRLSSSIKLIKRNLPPDEW